MAAQPHTEPTLSPPQAAAPPTPRASRRVRSTSPCANERRRNVVGLVDQQPTGDHDARDAHRATARRPRAAAAARSRFAATTAPPAPARCAGRTAAPRSATPLTAAFSRVASTAAGSKSSATTSDQPSCAATIASTPEPQPRSTNEPAAPASSSSSSRHSRVVACAPVPNACARVDHDVERRSSPGGSHGGRTVSRVAEHQRPVELAPALGPVVGDLGRRSPRRARRRRPPAGRAAPAARPAAP